MVRFLVLYDTPEDPAAFCGKQADVPTFAPTGVASVVYEVAEV